MGVEVIAGILVVVAIACVGGAAFLFFGESWLLQWLRGTAGLLLAGIALYLVLFAAGLFGYQQVRSDAPMATISLERTGNQVYMATVAEANGDRRQFELRGDLWQLDVRLLRYAGLLSMFGGEPSFRLEKLSSRYITVEDEETKDHSEYGLLPESFLGFDVWQRASDNGSWMVSASRSAVVLVPATDGAIYDLVLVDDKLTVSAANSAAEQALRRLAP